MSLTPEQRVELERIASANGRAPDSGWLESAADLLAEPDPGTTPFAVEGLIVDQAVAAVQGSYKVGKTWLLLELARAIVTGDPALGCFAVPRPGPVIVVLEESGRKALHRRLGALCRGTGTDPADLADLHFAANRRVRLDDPGWRDALLEAGQAIRPRAIVFDPLARLKGAEVDEDSQREMGPVLDFLRDLRDHAGGAVVWSHHTGHEGRRLRGTSDLEAYWESKVTVRREPEGVCELESEHREAEAGPTVRYRLAWHDLSRSIRLAPIEAPERRRTLRDELVEHVAANPGDGVEAIATAIGRRRQDTASGLRDGERDGAFARRPSEYRDAGGRRRQREGWYPASQSASLPVPDGGTGWDGVDAGASTAHRPGGGAPHRGGPRDGEPALAEEAGR